MTWILTKFFIIVLRSDQGLRMLPEIFQNSVNQKQAARTVLRESWSQQYYRSPTFRLSWFTYDYSWYTGWVDTTKEFFSSPKQEEGIIGRVTVYRFKMFPRWLPVCCQLVRAMIQYRIYRALKEEKESWRLSIDLTIKWDSTNIWCVPIHPYVFGYLWFFVTGFSGKGENKKYREGSKRHIFTETRLKGYVAQRIIRYLLIWLDMPNLWCAPTHPNVYDLFLLFANGFSGKGKIKSLWVERIKPLTDGIPQGKQRTQEIRYYQILGSRAQGGRVRRGKILQWRRQECPTKHPIHEYQEI